MPPWEQRLLSITSRWPGFSVINDRGVVVLLFRRAGQPSQRVSLTGIGQPLRYCEEHEELAITWLRQIYKLWDQAQGERTLKDCFNEAKGKSDVESAAPVTWAEIALAMREAKVENGRQIKAQTWKTNWEPILNQAVRVLSRKNAPADGYELLKDVQKHWSHAPATQRECARYLSRWMEFAERRYKVPRSWLITEADKQELAPRAPKRRKKAVLEDVEILEFVELVEAHSPAWSNVFRLCAQYGLRPTELQYLSVVKDPITGQRTFWCSYEKDAGGQATTEPRYLRAMYLRDADDRPVQWPLIEAWESGTLPLPQNRNGGLRKLSGSAVNTYLARQGKDGGPASAVQRWWKAKVAEYASKPQPEWLRAYSFRDSYSVRCHREGLPLDVIVNAMGHSHQVHQQSYRTVTNQIVARAFESCATDLRLPSTPDTGD